MNQRLASARLDRICAELEISPGVARRFVRDYLELLDERLARIDTALDAVGPAPEPTSPEPTGPEHTSPEPTRHEPTRPDGRSEIDASGDATVALLGLESSSSMLGAFPVALAARRLRIELQTGRAARVDGYRRELRLALQQVRAQLAEI